MTTPQTPDAEWQTLRDGIAVAYGIGQDDRDALLTGTDEDTLTAQASRLLALGIFDTPPLIAGNVARREGLIVQNSADTEREVHEFVGDLFNRAAD